MRHRWNLAVVGSALLLGVLVSTPQVLHVLDERYQGIAVHLNSDEYYYLPRVQEVLNGGSVGGAISGEALPALQPGLIETFYGILFRPLEIRAAGVLNVMDFVVPVFLFFVLYGFLGSCGFSKWRALTGTWLFCLLQLYGLGRPIHQGASLLLSILALWGLIEGMERRVIWGILGGVLMGLLVGVYFWAWTFVWAYWGLLMCVMIWRFVRGSRMELGKWFLFGGVGAMTAAPFFWKMYLLRQHPLFDEVFFRSGMGRSHMVESIPWSALFLLMAVGTVVIWMHEKKRRELYAVFFVVTVCAVLNQQVVHGIRFLFASHYLMWLVFGGVIALVYVWRRYHWKHFLVTGASLIFLAGIAYDNRHVFEQWQITKDDFSEQHLASALPILDQLERTTVLSDPATSAFLASYTHHNVLFTPYIQHELHSHRAIAERYCLTQVAIPPQERRPGDAHVLIYGAAYDAIFDEEERQRVREQELTLVSDVCAEVDLHVADFLTRYGVQYILWDQKRHPEWHIERLRLNLEEVKREEEWMIWKVRS
ncbi:hypothetical protein A2635_01320 [Candidatus Peribacteria bacterium RIFCSPHIGHO2_01_FULL_51_9]|nr:MAG: hypothetical protein A2635_01320 [Candidatus Peribacteria bacterium RIFCSPHIGHO2_01_FULL_51_9]